MIVRLFVKGTPQQPMDLPPRLRFKLDKLKSSIRSAFKSDEPTFDTSLRMCSACRALIDRNAGRCPHCGTSLKSARSRESNAEGRVLGGLIPVPSTATSALVAANIGLYAVAWYLTQSAASALQPAPGMGGIDGAILVRLGAKYGRLMYVGEWWRLVTAMFLHAGLLHIGFNLWCLFDLGPTVESLFSTPKFIFLYLVTGVAGFVFSLWWSPFGISVGASAPILGLIGILIGASFHHGRLGKDYRGQLWKWVMYIAVLGIMMPGIDNAAHAGGLVSGIVLGYIIPEGEPGTRAEENLWNVLAVLSVIIIAGSFALMALQLNRPLQ
jgi:rhomboid protease GluP